MHHHHIRIGFLLFSIALVGCTPEPSAKEYLERAKSHLEQGKLQSSVIETRNAVKSDPNNADARLLLGELELRTGNAPNAEKELLKAGELGVPQRVFTMLLARSLLKQAKFDDLVAIKISGLPDKVQASVLANQSIARLVANDIEAAQFDVDRALQLDPSSVEALLSQARIDAAQNDLPKARSSVRRALDAEPKFGEAWEFLGDLEQAEQKPDAAILAYDKAVEHMGDKLSSLLKRAQVNTSAEHFEAAAKDLDTLASAGVKLPSINMTRGEILFREGKYLEAQLQQEEALKLAPNYLPAVNGLTLTHFAMGNLGQAEQYGKQLVSETDGSVHARRLLSAIRLENGQYSQVEETLAPLVQAGTLDLLSTRMLGTALLKLRKYDDAIDLMTSLSPKISASNSASSVRLVLTQTPSVELFNTVGGGTVASEQNPVSSTDFLSTNEQQIAHVVELMSRQEHELALSAAQTLRVNLPDSAAPSNLIGRIHLQTGDLDTSRAAFEQSLELDPSNRSANLILAQLDSQAGDLDAARTRLEAALDSSDGSETVLLQLAHIEAEAKNELSMVVWLQRAIEEYPESIRGRLVLARYHASQAEHKQALEILAELNDRQRQQPETLQLLAGSHLSLRNFDKALEALNSLIDMQPENVQWRYQRAQAHAGLKDMSSIRAELEQALKMEPKHVPSQLALANAEILSGELEAAEIRINTLRDSIPGTLELNAVVARLETAKELKSSGQTTKRLESSDDVIEAARSLWGNGQRDDAISLMNNWLEKNPNDIPVRLTLANTYGSLDRAGDAIGEYETVLKTDHDNAIVLNNLAWYLRNKDPAKAVSYAEKGLEIDADNVAILDTLAVIHLENNDLAAAKNAFDRIIVVGTENATILFHGAQIEHALGNNDAARALLTPLIDGKREFPEAEEAGRIYVEVQ